VFDGVPVLLASACAGRLVSAPVQELLKQFSLEKFESFAGLAHGSEIRGQFLCAVAGEHLRQFPVARLECGQRGQSGTTKVLEGIVCHENISSNCREAQSAPYGLHSRYINNTHALVIESSDIVGDR
jgi:hypothetical protein